MDPEQAVRDWSSLVGAMARSKPAAFTRTEWAYLATFLDPENLRRPFLEEFGPPALDGVEPSQVARPRGQVALWLPNNVSLLGPLTAVLISLVGNPLRAKSGSRGADLLSEFLDFARVHLPQGVLASWLRDGVLLEQFDRFDARNRDMAATASVRIAFGSDESARAIESLPHPVGSLGIYFTDRVSEAWVEPSALCDEAIATLARVFAVYGRRGCTSPARVVILEGCEQDAVRLRDRLVALWPRAVRSRPERHVASECIMAWQMGLALGWETRLAEAHGAVFASGAYRLGPIDGTMVLPITWAPLEQAVLGLPSNIQTIGHALQDAEDPKWRAALQGTGVKRFVPLSTMHHFSHVWDGVPFWRHLFEEADL